MQLLVLTFHFSVLRHSDSGYGYFMDMKLLDFFFNPE